MNCGAASDLLARACFQYFKGFVVVVHNLIHWPVRPIKQFVEPVQGIVQEIESSPGLCRGWRSLHRHHARHLRLTSQASAWAMVLLSLGLIVYAPHCPS